jgi:hypothetical protein
MFCKQDGPGHEELAGPCAESGLIFSDNGCGVHRKVQPTELSREQITRETGQLLNSQEILLASLEPTQYQLQHLALVSIPSEQACQGAV